MHCIGKLLARVHRCCCFAEPCRTASLGSPASPSSFVLCAQKRPNPRIQLRSCSYSGLTLAKTIVVLMTGLVTGLLALVMTRSSSIIIEWRNERLQHYIDVGHNSGGHAFLWYLLFSVSVTSFGGCLVRLHSTGSLLNKP